MDDEENKVVLTRDSHINNWRTPTSSGVATSRLSQLMSHHNICCRDRFLNMLIYLYGAIAAMWSVLKGAVSCSLIRAGFLWSVI